MSPAATQSLPGLELDILDMMACIVHLTLAGPKPPLHSLPIIARFFGKAAGRKIGSFAGRGGRAGGSTRACQACVMALSTSVAAAIVASMSASVCTLEKKRASYWLHGR